MLHRYLLRGDFEAGAKQESVGRAVSLVNAPPSVIWELLIDLDHYHRWNPFIFGAKGRIADGETVEVSPRLTAKRQTTFRLDVTGFEEESCFAWTGAIIHRWIARGEHSFRLTVLTDNRVVVDHDERFFGIGGLLVGLAAGRLTERGFVAMNQALKQAAEGRSSARERVSRRSIATQTAS